jgi:hypothetical protein
MRTSIFPHTHPREIASNSHKSSIILLSKEENLIHAMKEKTLNTLFEDIEM